ncbi:uridylate-specific endoribonuclease isoform X2 [Hyla sarda]|uniref:uridylate-specific endoribonuclease isoform X2 n=1 Tax=Hyla sarda TaxID=327740 RepID=UPI0024C321BF|nr:uridylate-specific endoribonuclease isoform X2 [Hyla sarda]
MSMAKATYMLSREQKRHCKGCKNSCKNRCGDKPNKSYSCQCNAHCESFGDCCEDYSICSYIDPDLNEVTHHDSSDTDSKLHVSSYKDKSDTSCQGRCGERFNKKHHCHCNNKCEKFENCCSDYSKLCSRGASNDNKGDGNKESNYHRGTDISKEEIKAVSEILYQSDVNKAAESDIVLNKQEMSDNTKHKEDLCEEPLYQYVNEEIFKRPTYKAFIALLDNYDRKTGTDETFTQEETKEQDIFLEEILKTKVMKELYKFFHKKGMYEKEQEFLDDLRKMWFGLYSRSSGEQDSSGFEHVFVGEVKKGIVSGFHSWIRFYLLEKKELLDYYSHNYDGPWTSYPDVLGKQFHWDGFHKEVGTQLIGSSPEFDFALYTLCFISRPGKKCTVSMGGHEISIQTYEWTKTSYGKNKKHIATCYPTF